MRKIPLISILFLVISLSVIYASGRNKNEIKFSMAAEPTIKEWSDSLLKYMPQIDLVSINKSFLTDDFKAILKAREEVFWAKKIPDRIFYYYILPYRVSQEPLNNFRYLYSDSLLSLVKNVKDMRTAILKIDDWVTIHNRYKPTSPWDQSPIVTLKRGFGRCEEMATLLIMALRTVYIPARFVYTPWWPFTNSNHAWVEVWVDGKWQYIGKLKNPNDWVVGATKRTALVAGTIWGKSNLTDEPVLNNYRMFTVINSTPNYENTKSLKINVTNENGTPASDVKINIYVYNYSAFRSITNGKTDSSGIYKIEIGKTSLMVTAAKDGQFAWSLVEKCQDSLSLQLSDRYIPDTSFWFYAIPPTKIRYKGEKYTPPDTTYLAQKVYLLKLNPINTGISISFPQKDDSTFIDILKSSYGNYSTILNFFNNLSDEKKQDLITILRSINKKNKDLVSVNSKELSSLLKWYEANKKRIAVFNDTISLSYIISPRIYFEDFGTYKDTFSTIFGNLVSPAGTDSTVENVIRYVNTVIDTTMDTCKSRFGGLMNPMEVYRSKSGKPLEKYILSIGILRSLAIPSRLNYANKGIEYYNGNEWINMIPSTDSLIKYSNVKIVFHDEVGGNPLKLRYYYDFTIDELDKDKIVPLDLDIADSKDTIECTLAPGHYFIVNGWRNLYGSAYIRINNFKLTSDSSVLNISAGIPVKDIGTGNLIIRKFSIHFISRTSICDFSPSFFLSL